ncbi:unnamed protein product [Blepharisma stoltei]|uniref:Uncharacterized protein n=1 Tax=Blepharisma stoltei TaxID=1481888 RepID=A0AAU9KA84_9CILI|nr:unnamed protein product [Blepharisma stoltei]
MSSHEYWKKLLKSSDFSSKIPDETIHLELLLKEYWKGRSILAEIDLDDKHDEKKDQEEEKKIISITPKQKSRKHVLSLTHKPVDRFEHKIINNTEALKLPLHRLSQTPRRNSAKSDSLKKYRRMPSIESYVVRRQTDRIRLKLKKELLIPEGLRL